MAIIKTEVDTDKDKKVAGKGVDYISKELEQLNSKFSKRINQIMTHLGISIDINNNVESDGNLNAMSEQLSAVTESLESGVMISKKYETEFTNTYNWNEGLIWSKNHGLGGVPDMIEVWAKFSGNYYMKLAHQVAHSSGSTNDHYLTSIVVNNTSVRFEVSDDLDETYFDINGVMKDPDDITSYKIIAIKF